MDIAIVTAGGTIDKDYFDALSEYQVADSYVGELLRHVRVNFQYEIVPVLRKDSLEMTDDDRALLKAKIDALTCDHVLLTHGTDTMAETARYLAPIENKTIVLTGAMKPARFKDSDAIFNIGFALGALRTLPHGVYLAMSGCVFNPFDVHKDRKAGQFLSGP